MTWLEWRDGGKRVWAMRPTAAAVRVVIDRSKPNLNLGSVRTPGGSRGLQSRCGVVYAAPGGFDSHPLPCISLQIISLIL